MSASSAQQQPSLYTQDLSSARVLPYASSHASFVTSSSLYAMTAGHYSLY
jgi:hypothetical protein